MKVRKYFRVSPNGKVLGEVKIRLDQFEDLRGKLKQLSGQRLFRKRPKSK